MTFKNQDLNNEKEQREWFQIIAILLGSLSSLSTGLLVSWPSPFMPKIVEDRINYNITEEQASYFAVLSVVGVIILSPFFVPFIKIIGPKKGLLLSSVPYTTAWLIKGLTTNLWGLYFARLAGGCGDALTFSCLPVYIGEVATPKVRGIWGNSFVCAIFFGQFLINLLGAYFTVKQTSWICITIPVILIALFPFMPDSPYYFISKGKYEEAKDSLRKLRRLSNVDEEFKQIKAAVERQLSESGTWMDLFRIKSNRKAFFIASFIRCSQLFGGLMTFASYTKYIFIKSSTKIDPNLAAIIYTAVSASAHSIASIGSNRLGRRKSLIFSLLLTGLVLTTLAVYFLIQHHYPDVNLENINWFPLAAMVTYLLFSSFGVGTVPSLMLGELFSSSIKGKGVAIIASLFGASAFVANNVFYYLSSYIGLYIPFFMFGIYNLIAVVITYYILPETRGKTLEEIQLSLRRK